MSLPKIPMPSVTVHVGDADVPVRGLTLSEIRQVMSDDVSADEADALCLSWATGETVEDARIWLAATPAGDQLKVLQAIREASGMGEGAQFAVERALALGEEDWFPYVLAEKLGKSLAEVEAMPHAEYVRWRAFHTYRTAMEQHAHNVAEMRSH